MPALSAEHLYSVVNKTFGLVPDPRQPRNGNTLRDCLMSGLAVFALKYPSLLQFEEGNLFRNITHNLKTLFHINNPPSDTYLRERLDETEPRFLRKPFNKIIALAQRNKQLEPFVYFEGHYLISLDGTGYFCSRKVHCASCCVKNHKDGEKTYYHQLLGAAMVHPHRKEVIPFPPEPIQKQDGNNKNDCEQVASKRFLEDLRREHPHLKTIILQDALAATGPHIEFLKSKDFRFIIGARQYAKDFDFIDQALIKHYRFIDDTGTEHVYRYVNDLALNSAHLDLKVNFLDYQGTTAKGEVCRFTWVTDLPLNNSTVHKVMKGARTRWKIENETFNTLKNQGYHFEHNFGHGYLHLSTVFAHLMLLAFLIDQVQQLGCKLFKAALERNKRKIRFWERMRWFILDHLVGTWSDVWNILSGKKKLIFQIDTS